MNKECVSRRSQTQDFLTPGNTGDSGTYHFENAALADCLNKGIQFITATGQLNRIDRGTHIHDLAPEDINGTLDLGALRPNRLHLDQHQLTLDMSTFRQVNELHHLNQLVELLGDLLDNPIRADRGHRQARQCRLFGRCDRQGFNVVIALGKKTNNPREGARFVLKQDRNNTAHAAYTLSVLLSHISFMEPRATCIGYTCSAGSTYTSRNTSRSFMAKAFSRAGTNSSRLRTVIPTWPYASTSFMKSGKDSM